MDVPTRLQGIRLRRARRSDAAALAELMRLKDFGDGGVPAGCTFGVVTTQEFACAIEESLLSLTAVATLADGVTKVIVGALAFGGGPGVASFPAHCWEGVLQASGLFSSREVDVRAMGPCNTAWMNLLLAPPSDALRERESLGCAYGAKDLATEMLVAALNCLPEVQHVLSALTGGVSTFPLLKAIAHPLAFAAPAGGVHSEGFSFDGDVVHLARDLFVPPLQLRLGRVQDYDAFVPLLLAERGVITELPATFYLDELLKDQDEIHKVVVAENPLTHHVVGLACLTRLSQEEEQRLTRQYLTESVDRFRVSHMSDEDTATTAPGSTHSAPLPRDKRDDALGAAATASSNTVMMDFLYFNPDYSGSCAGLLPFIFKQFPDCEFLAVFLPHDVEEPPLLKPFQYLPIRKYQPHNTRGESLPVPPGLWVCCTYSLDNMTVEVVRDEPGQASVHDFCSAVSAQPDGLPVETQQLIAHDLLTSLESEGLGSFGDGVPLPNAAAFQMKLSRTRQVVGVASMRRLHSRDVYALRANYDLDEYYDFYARTGHNYEATNIHLTPHEGCRSFQTPCAKAVLIRAAYVRPQFQPNMRFFLQEVMRLSGADVAVVLAPPNLPSAYRPLLTEMVVVSPRRVMETVVWEDDACDAPGSSTSGSAASSPNKHGVEEAEGASEKACARQVFAGDIGATDALFMATQRLLGDEVKRVHTRLVVAGAGATGLSFLYQLRRLPYIRFTNLVLVSTDGLPPHPNQCDHQWSADTMDLLEREYTALIVAQPVRVVAGTVVDLDKYSKFVSIDNGTFETYDYLLLNTGRQYTSPPSIRRLQQQEGRSLKAGVLAMNGDLARDRLVQRLQDMDRNPNSVANVVVYGSGLDALAVVQAMIEVGFASQRIVVASPAEKTPYMNEDAFQATVALLQALGTTVFRGFDVTRLEYDDDNGLQTVMLSPVSHESEAGQSVEMACALIVCVENKDIDANILSTLNKRSIVFDGRVIVENNYRTTDPSIFAAGPVAMFTRRYGDTPVFDDYSAREVGEHVASILLGYLGFDEFVDPQFHGFSEGGNQHTESAALYTKVLEENGSASHSAKAAAAPSQDTAQGTDGAQMRQLPTYHAAVAHRLALPAGHTFFSAYAASFDVSQCVPLTCSTLDMVAPLAAFDGEDDTHNEHGDEEEQTRDGEHEDRTTRYTMTIYVNKRTRTIDGISYFGNGTPEVHQYRALIGYPESVLNLVFRYDEGLLRGKGASPQCNTTAAVGLTARVVAGTLDLVEYLRLPHLQIVFCDRFATFFAQLRRKMDEQEVALAMKRRILDEHQYDGHLTPEQINEYKKALTVQQNDFKYAVQLELIKFLHEQKAFWPQTAFLPDVRKEVAQA